MTKILLFLKNPNVLKWISDVIKIGFGVCLGGVLFFGSIYILIGLEKLIR